MPLIGQQVFQLCPLTLASYAFKAFFSIRPASASGSMQIELPMLLYPADKTSKCTPQSTNISSFSPYENLRLTPTLEQTSRSIFVKFC